jgi:hypothetical protein
MNIQEAIVEAKKTQTPDRHGCNFIRRSDWKEGWLLQLPANGQFINVRHGEQAGFGLTCADVLVDNWEISSEVPET